MASDDSPKYLAAAKRLPDELRPIYKDLVQQYAFLTQIRYGKGYVEYDVLADLVLAGWRLGSMNQPARAELKPYADKLHEMRFQGSRPGPDGNMTMPLHGIRYLDDLR